MTKVEFLCQIRDVKQKIVSNSERIRSIKEVTTDITGSNWEPKYKSTRPTNASYAYLIEDLIDCEAKLNQEIQFFMEIESDIYQAIRCIPKPELRSVLEHRYICNLTWNEIAAKLSAGEKTVRRWHTKAMELLVVPDKYNKS